MIKVTVLVAVAVCLMRRRSVNDNSTYFNLQHVIYFEIQSEQSSGITLFINFLSLLLLLLLLLQLLLFFQTINHLSIKQYKANYSFTQLFNYSTSQLINQLISQSTNQRLAIISSVSQPVSHSVSQFFLYKYLILLANYF